MVNVDVEWWGPYSLDQLTPKELIRKMGLYAVTSGPSYIFVGGTLRGKAIFREAKVNREEEYWDGLKALGIVSGDKPAWFRLRDDVYRHCELYAGLVSKTDYMYVDDLRKQLIFKLKPICNDRYLKELKSGDVNITHYGNLPPGLRKPEIADE